MLLNGHTVERVLLAVLKLSQRNSQLEAEITRCQQELTQLRAKSDVLQHENEKLVLAYASKMDVDEHINTVAALKQ